MPNHVTNVIALNGDRKQICELLERTSARYWNVKVSRKLSTSKIG